MGSRHTQDLIYDWNTEGADGAPGPGKITFDDETLRDGLQSPSVYDPPVDAKKEILDKMAAIGIDTANLGLPGAGEAHCNDIMELALHIRDQHLPIRPNVACRTVISDIAPVRAIMDRSGLSVLACCFIGSSPIRLYAEDWTIDTLLGYVEKSLTYARDHDIPVMFVTEDTTRAQPEDLRALYGLAIDLGAERVCVCDTCGHATPEGTHRVVSFVKKIVEEKGKDVGIDWHGHRDRNLDLVNCIAAVEAGATEIHGAALGVGERAGNAPMDLILANFQLLGWIDRDLTALGDYVRTCSKHLKVAIPHNYPVFGHDAFVTGTGVHASAVIKALRKGDAWLADRVYSGVPATDFGERQRVSVGYMSGRSNVLYWLDTNGYDMDDTDLVDRVFDAAKASDHLMTDDEIHAIISGAQAG
ncbi:MAG: 2-isopropylmalate synthase [Planctomycetes bacterium]|nr:2-isopropylmalate synthase [Planctomycetota bacterium]